MGVYDQCLQLVDTNKLVESAKKYVELTNINQINTTIPEMLSDNLVMDIESVYYVSDIHLEHKIVKKFPNGATDNEVYSYIKSLARELISDEFIRDTERLRQPIVLFAGDIASDFNLAKIFYTEFMEYWDNLADENSWSDTYKRYAYAVLGNHEFWEFNSLTDCYNAYTNLFNYLGIKLLNNETSTFGKSMNIIVGGTGFAGYNEDFNANKGLYRNTISREIEIEETKAWEMEYNRALSITNKLKCPLIVLTHNPITDWKSDRNLECDCIYFSGHSHKNYIYHEDNCNIHILADNQIGYNSTRVKLKKAYIYGRINPFAGYVDGCHEINCEDYTLFYSYICERIRGTGLIERRISNDRAKFYMIKHNGYYGFFLTSNKGSYICAGGRVKKIDTCGDIKQIETNFLSMINAYLNMFSPFRNAQEKIAEAVKSFGGEGRIHGCIIDIDFTNHIMLNPNDGTITYYNSPVFGSVKTYNNILDLLSNHNTLLESNYKRQLKLCESASNILVKSQINSTDEFIKIDIKNSLYTISGKIQQVQRLFDKKLLRDWDTEILQSICKNDIKKLN